MTRLLFRLGIALVTFTFGVGSNAATKKMQRVYFDTFDAPATKAAPELRAQPAPLMTNVEPIMVGGDDLRPLQPESASPYAIARVVNKSKELWEKYKVDVKVDLGSVWKQLNLEPGSFETCDAQCEASIFKYEFDGEPGEEILLKLIRSPNDTCRYVLFSGSETVGLEPKLIGHVDHDFNRYEMSTHRVINVAGKNWLVIRGQVGSGSGFSLYGETWYEVRKKSLRSMLYYPESGHTSSWPQESSRDFKAEVSTSTPTEGRNEKPVLTIRYSVSYSMNESGEKEDALLFENEHHARYVWNERKREFVFDAKLSDVKEGEIFAIAGYEDPELEVGSDDLFFKYNLESLLKIARGQDDKCKEWLRKLLEDCNDTPATKALLKALQN
jgi:hypothetical protein